MLILTPVLGETIKLHPIFNLDRWGFVRSKPIPGKIVYINRKHRFFSAEFKCENGSFRESFKYIEQGDIPCQIK